MDGLGRVRLLVNAALHAHEKRERSFLHRISLSDKSKRRRTAMPLLQALFAHLATPERLRLLEEATVDGVSLRVQIIERLGQRGYRQLQAACMDPSISLEGDNTPGDQDAHVSQV